MPWSATRLSPWQRDNASDTQEAARALAAHHPGELVRWVMTTHPTSVNAGSADGRSKCSRSCSGYAFAHKGATVALPVDKVAALITA